MRLTRRKSRKIKQRGGVKLSIKIDLPEEIVPALSEVLWLDREPEQLHLTLNAYSGINGSLRNLLMQLGATERMLNRSYSVICGPTGVGKTKFINHLKVKYTAEVINMDTMQVYDMISVGTGRTNLANTKGSHLYGIYNPNKQFHILDYLLDMVKELQKIDDDTPILFDGASKSLLDVLMRIFPNLHSFGIKAINEANITSNITKRIPDTIVKKAILELAAALKEKMITYNSDVLKNNPEVYTLIISSFSRDELNDTKLEDKLVNDYSSRLHDLTLAIVARNIALHKQQFARLQTIPQIQWFTNDDASIELLEKAFVASRGTTTAKSILQETQNFNFINTESCAAYRRNPSREQCKEINTLFHSEDRNAAIQIAARMNVPLIPKKESKQVVIGTTKYLLPYAVLSDSFSMFAIKQEHWSLERNMMLIECIASKFIDNNIIRLVTTPSELVDAKQGYRITAKEICILKTYSYNFYKYDSQEFTNVYFCSKVPLNNCSLVDVSQGAFRCNGNDIGEHLYF